MPNPHDWYSDLQGGAHWDEVLLEDEVFKVSQRGAQALQAKWERRTKDWKKVLISSLRGGLFGMGSPVADWRQVYNAIYSKRWPSGLTRRERRLIQLAVASHSFNPSWTQGLTSQNTFGPEDTLHVPPGPEAEMLKAFRKYANAVEAKIYTPMEKDLKAQLKVTRSLILDACERVYPNNPKACTPDRAGNMFLNDLQRGSHASNLRVSPTMYRVLPAFFSLYQGL